MAEVRAAAPAPPLSARHVLRSSLWSSSSSSSTRFRTRHCRYYYAILIIIIAMLPHDEDAARRGGIDSGREVRVARDDVLHPMPTCTCAAVAVSDASITAKLQYCSEDL